MQCAEEALFETDRPALIACAFLMDKRSKLHLQRPEFIQESTQQQQSVYLPHLISVYVCMPMCVHACVSVLWEHDCGCFLSS